MKTKSPQKSPSPHKVPKKSPLYSREFTIKLDNLILVGTLGTTFL